MTAAATADGVPTAAELTRARLRLGALALLLSVAGLVLLAALALSARELGAEIDDLGALAAPVLALAGAVLIAAMVPASLVAGAAGFAAGTAEGFAVALVASTAGALICAATGRRVGTPAARHALGGRIARSVAFLDARPFRSVALARLVPGMPFNAASYALGVTRIPLRDVGAGTALGFAPRCFAYVALGGSLRDLGAPEAKAALAASLVLLLVVVLAPRLLLRRTDSPDPEERTDG